MSSASQFGAVTTIDGVSPVLGNVAFTSTGGTVTITPGVGTINFEASGGGGSGIVTINGNTGSVTGSTVAIHGSDGATFASSGTTLTMSFTRLVLPNTTSPVVGSILINGVPFLSGYPGTANSNAFIGGAGNLSSVTGTFDTAVGAAALGNATGAAECTAIGASSMSLVTTGTQSTAVGVLSLGANVTGSGNCAFGYLAGNNYRGSESNNITIGSIVTGTTGESGQIRIGVEGTQTACQIAGIYGNTPGGGAQVVYVDSSGNLTSASGGGGSVTINGDSGSVSGSTLTLTGGSSGAMFTGSGTTLTETFEFLTMAATDASQNGTITIGSNLFASMYGTDNIFIGGAGNFTLTIADAVGNIGIGNEAFGILTTGTNNTVVGTSSGGNILNGGQNTLYGATAGAAVIDGLNNTLVGYGAGGGVGSSGGDTNTCIGWSAGGQLTGTEANNIYIGCPGVGGESAAIRIGNVTTGSGFVAQTSCQIAGVFGSTVTGSPVLCDSSGNFGTVSSSARYKTNIQDLGPTDVMKLRPVSFSYKSGGPLQSGLIAEEVEQVMPRLVVPGRDGSPESVMYHELPVLLLNEIKKMAARIDSLEAIVASHKL